MSTCILLQILPLPGAWTARSNTADEHYFSVEVHGVWLSEDKGCGLTAQCELWQLGNKTEESTLQPQWLSQLQMHQLALPSRCKITFESLILSHFCLTGIRSNFLLSSWWVKNRTLMKVRPGPASLFSQSHSFFNTPLGLLMKLLVVRSKVKDQCQSSIYILPAYRVHHYIPPQMFWFCWQWA